MATDVVSAAFSVVGKALAPLTDGLLKNWAASVNLASNVEALKQELLSVQALLGHTNGKKIADNPGLEMQLLILQDLGYDADDVLDELEYFRIQDELDGTFNAADKHAKGATQNMALHARHTVKAVGKQIWMPACFSSAATSGTKAKAKHTSSSRSCYNPIHAVGKCFHSSSLPSDPDDGIDDNSVHNSAERDNTDNEPPKLRFDRVDASKRMEDIVSKLRLARENVSSIISTLGSTNIFTVQDIAQSRPVTMSESIEQKLYGRDHMMNNIINDITRGKHSTKALTVIPIVGPRGIGKTAFAQHIYHSEEVQRHFDVKVWTCVSLNFNVNNLIQEIKKYIPKVGGESSNGTAIQLIRQRLENKRLMLVLDDIWDCSDEDEWKQLLLPFENSKVQGNIILATTRFPEQAQTMIGKLYDHQSIHLQGLENAEFKELFLEIVFGHDDQCIEDHKFLLETGFKIVDKLKGFPLAAKTVGRLLKTQLDLDHWKRILESKEWEHSNGKNDIMPALKLSFNFLPSHQLKQCFTYCALFPQDYKFKEEDLINFWIGQEVVHSSCGENRTVEDIERSHLTELVDYGFLERKQEKDGSTCYNIHDLLHELACNVSSHECLFIDSSQSQLRSLQALPSIRHLSINIDDASVKDRFTLKNCVEDFNTLVKRLKVEKLRTLMLFGEHHGCFVKAFGGLLREAKGLRVVFISQVSYNVEDLLHNLYHLVHLRYLRIVGSVQNETRFPNKLSRFYHMMVLHAEYRAYIDDLPRYMSNLAKLRHFLVQSDSVHSSIVEVGKLTSLQELRRFEVKKENQGFELKQIGHLVKLCGSLCIDKLENVEVKEEADEAKLLQKGHLRELILKWNDVEGSTSDSTLQELVLERLKPNSNLLKLSVEGHRGATCPSWLGTNLSVENLESLCLRGVAWKTFPPIGEFGLVDLPREENISNRMFGNLRRLELCELTMVKKWAVHSPCHLFPFCEVLIVKDCPQLGELSFQHIACCRQGKEVNKSLFPRLKELKISNCPQLSSFPPVPWNEAPCSFDIRRTGIPCLRELVCKKEDSQSYSLTIEGKNATTGSTFWNVLDFHKLTGLTELTMDRCESPPLPYLQMLSSLRILMMSCSSNTFPFVEADNHVKYQFPVERLFIDKWEGVNPASGKELTQLLTYFPKLSDLWLRSLEKVTGLGVNMRGQRATESRGPSPTTNKVEQQQDARAEDGTIVASEEEHGLLLLPPQLQDLCIETSPELSLCSNPHNDSNQDGRIGGGGGLQGLASLRNLVIIYCPKILSSYSSLSFSSVPFPNSLELLRISSAVGTEVLLPLSNLTSLTSLYIEDCRDLRGEGLLSLLTQGHLTKLGISETPNFFVDSEQSWVHEQDLPSRSSKLQELIVDDVAGFTDTPIRSSLIFSALTELVIDGDNKVKRFTEEQEVLLFVNSLENITFMGCYELESLPKRLHGLRNLKRLAMLRCKAIQLPPKDVLPSSLEELKINHCSKIESLPKDCLPDSLQKLVINDCPAIRSLPEVDDLPSSLRELYVSSDGNSEELRSQCRRFINIIPIVKA